MQAMLLAFYGAQVVFFLCYIYLYRLLYRNVVALEIRNRYVDPNSRLNRQHQNHGQRDGFHRQQKHKEYRANGDQVDLYRICCIAGVEKRKWSIRGQMGDMGHSRTMCEGKIPDK